MQLLSVLNRARVRRLLRSPAVQRLAGAPPVSDRGVPLDAQTHAMVRAMRVAGLPRMDELGSIRGREVTREEAALAGPEGPRLHRVEDRRLDGLRARVYHPRPSTEPRPALLYFHGGGFVLGDLDSHDGVCRVLAESADVVVVAVDYRLAPEHPFPAAALDTVIAWDAVVREADALGIDPRRIAVGGDSAGGNLSAVLCLSLRDAGAPMPAFQLLVYPATDFTRSMPSHRTFARGFFLEAETIDWFLASYLTDPSQELDPRASPLLVKDLAGLPPAHIATAGFDPLRDEGEAYGARLMEAGVPTTVRCYDSLVHGFASMAGLLDAGAWSLMDLARVLRAALQP